MFRNSYLDTYKHAVLYNKEVEVLFVHLSQIYTTLGSVINDIEYQFGLLLSKTNQIDQKQRNSNKATYGSKPPQGPMKTDFDQLQNKLENFHNIEQNKIPSVNYEYKAGGVQKQSTKPKISQQQIQLSERRGSKQKYVPIIESTQDFESLFLNPKQQIVNQNSNSRQQPKEGNRGKERSSGGNVQKSVGNKRSEDEEIDYMEKLFRN